MPNEPRLPVHVQRDLEGGRREVRALDDLVHPPAAGRAGVGQHGVERVPGTHECRCALRQAAPRGPITQYRRPNS